MKAQGKMIKPWVWSDNGHPSPPLHQRAHSTFRSTPNLSSCLLWLPGCLCTINVAEWISKCIKCIIKWSLGLVTLHPTQELQLRPMKPLFWLWFHHHCVSVYYAVSLKAKTKSWRMGSCDFSHFPPTWKCMSSTQSPVSVYTNPLLTQRSGLARNSGPSATLIVTN